MNFVEKFDGHLPNADAYARGTVHVESVSTHAPPGAITVDDGQLLFTGDFKRTGLDLVIAKDDRELVLHDYFKGEKRAALASPDGAHLTGDLVNALTGYTQYAQAGGAAEPAKVIGHVTKLTGSATAIRNGVAIVLNQGDNVNKGDVVQSGSDSTLGVTFIDGTVFGLGPNAKMVLNEMIYDPNGSSNSSLMSLVSGTISFVAGATAKHGDMKVDTPVATMGIRGTAVLVEIDFDVQGSGGVPPAKFQVLVEPDGTTGSYILFDKTTLNPIATVDQAGTQTIVNGQGSVSFVSSAQLSADAQRLISDVFALKFTDNNNPNTKLTSNFTDSVVPDLTTLKLATGDVILPTSFVLGLLGNTGPQAAASKPDHAPGAPHVETQNAAFTELAGQTHSTLLDTVSGQITWVDVNLGDKPTAVVNFSTFSYKDASGNDVTSTLTAAEQAAIKAVEIPLLLEPNPLNNNIGSATWTYSLADGAFDFLAAGETLTLTYLVRVDNNYAPSNETAFKTFTITITGTNDTPVVTSSAQVGSITELPWTTNSAAPDTANGTLTFTDADLTDTHSVTIIGVTEAGVTSGLANQATVLSWLSLGTLIDSTDGVTGSRSWTFSATDKSFDYLAAGETLTLTYTIQIDDHHGGVITEPVTITIVGTDDKPVITSPAQAAAITEANGITGSVQPDVASGTVTFTDVDLSDTHSVTVAGVTETGVTTGLPDQATILSWMSLGTLKDSTGGVTGSSAWTFSAADKNFDYLAAGEKLTLTYLIQVDDHHGGVVTQPVTITITGTNDVPTFTSAPPTATVAEQPDTTGSSKPDTAVGVVAFADVDLSDTHSVSITGVTESGTTTGLPEDESTILNWLSLGTLTDSTGGVAGSQAWTFSAADQNFDYLAAGETLTLTYTVKIDDHHGGVISEPVTITITGSNDVPTVTSEAQTATIAEQPDTTGSSKADSATGTVTFTDVDLSDTHTMTITGVAESGDTAGLPEDESTILNWLSLGTLTDATNGGIGSSTWTFSAADKNFDYLAAGETLTLTYTIQIDDHHGGVVNEPVTVTINGANDAPTLAFNPTYLNFDGSTTAVGAVATTHVGNGSDGVTLAGWVDWSGNGNAGDSQLLFYNGSTSDAGLGVNGVVTADGLLDLQIQNGGIGGIDTGITISAGAWHNIALTHVNGEFTLYVDGVVEFTTNANVQTIPGSFADFTLIGGVSSEDGSSFATEGFKGAIADVSIWNMALTQAQVQALQSTTLAGNESGLAAYFPLSDGSGTGAADLVGSAGDLAIHGNPAWVVNGDSSWPATDLSTVAGTLLSITGLKVSDVDTGDTEQVTLSVGHGAIALTNADGVTVSANGADGTLTFSGTVAAVDAVLAGGVVYTPAAGYHGADSLHVSTTDQGALTATMDLAINVGPASPLEIHTDNLVVTGNGGGETISGLTVTDAGASVDETFTLVATTGSGSSVTPSSQLGSLSDINTVLGSGLDYKPGQTPPATDKIALSVTDSHGATDTVNLIFNVQQDPPQPVTLTGTSDKDVFFGSGYQDKFVFAPNFNHDTILNFTPGQDQIDLSTVVSATSFTSWFDQHVTTSPTNSADTLITIDSADTITLHNVSKASLSQNDFLIHLT